MILDFDTSTLVAALVKAHPAHERARSWLDKVRNGLHTGVVAAHTIAELYAILTRLPYQPPITPSEAYKLIQADVCTVLTVVCLSDADYLEVVKHLADLGITGGTTYDALLMFTAAKAGADVILTLNPRHFRRVYPSLADKVVEP